MAWMGCWRSILHSTDMGPRSGWPQTVVWNMPLHVNLVLDYVHRQVLYNKLMSLKCCINPESETRRGCKILLKIHSSSRWKVANKLQIQTLYLHFISSHVQNESDDKIEVTFIRTHRQIHNFFGYWSLTKNLAIWNILELTNSKIQTEECHWQQKASSNIHLYIDVPGACCTNKVPLFQFNLI